MRRAVALTFAVVVVAVGCTGQGRDQLPRPSVTTTTSDPVPVAGRAAHTMTALPAGGLLVAGGCVVDGCVAATDTAYLLVGDRNAPTGAMAQARDAHTATALPDGRVLVTGGFTGEGLPPLASAEIYDPATGRWTSVGRLRTGRGGHAAALLRDGRVLVAGGWVAPRTFTATTEIFDPKTARWTPGPTLPSAVDGLAAASLADGSVLVVGGQSSPGVASEMAVRVAPDGSLTRVGPLATPRFKHGVVRLASGRVLVVGGTPDDRRLLDSTEVFDPESARFTAGPRLRDGRYKLAGSVVLLPDGRVVVAGGGPGVEVVDLRTGTSRRLGAFGAGRGSFSTAGVSQGRLVVLGGYDEAIRLTGSQRSVPLATL